MTKRNVLNLVQINEFIEARAQKYPEYSGYIKTVVKNYLVRSAPATRNYFFRFKRKKTDIEKKIVKNGGPFLVVQLGEEVDSQIAHIVDYFKGNKISPLNTIAFDEALKNHASWISTMIKRQTTSSKDTVEDRVHDFQNGFFIVRLVSESSYKIEGKKMNHCVGSYAERQESEIYSLRDANNEPLVTFEVRDQKVVQVAEKNNAMISEMHKVYLNQFGKERGLRFYKMKKVSSGGPLGQIISPAIATFMSFQWRQMLAWFDLPPELIKSAIFVNAISLGLGMFAFMKWMQFFSEFSVGSYSYEKTESDSL